MAVDPPTALAGDAALVERGGTLWCEGVALSDLADSVGTPCYVYSETLIRRRYAAFSAAFAAVPHRIFYSVKANHNVSILRLMHGLGAGADVVSAGELYRARRAGFAGREIVFGGVGKRSDELEAALEAGVLFVNVESEGELRLLAELAGARGVVAPVALRVNPGVEAGKHAFTQTGHYKTKFGVAWEEAERLYEFAAASRHLAPVAIDTHIGSQILSAEPYDRALERLGQLLNGISRRGIKLRYLDMGGGFGVPYEGEAEIDLAAVARSAGKLAVEFNLTCAVEPGRWLVAPAGVLLTRVLYMKRLGEQNYCVVDAGSNDFLRPSYYGARHPVEAVRRGEPAIEVDVVGPVCETGDFLGRACLLPATDAGDLLAVLFAGAYGAVMSSNYNSRPRAAEVLVSGDAHRVIRRRESLEDLLAAEVADDE
ncbi:MAG: diaminopimelate decarboxylase [Gemmatimonadota bacterium]|nr:MAG: diaminopimelate decarboxylase [Gemmatimonadota bacterium]